MLQELLREQTEFIRQPGSLLSPTSVWLRLRTEGTLSQPQPPSRGPPPQTLNPLPSSAQPLPKQPPQSQRAPPPPPPPISRRPAPTPPPSTPPTPHPSPPRTGRRESGAAAVGAVDIDSLAAAPSSHTPRGVLGPEVAMVRTVPCPKCERRFASDRLEKHRKICEATKDIRSRGGVFDAAHKRTEDLEHVPTTASTANAPKPANHWREQHQKLLRTIGRGHAGDGLPLEDLDDRVPCPHCHRKFQADVARKHIEKCNYQKAGWKK